METMDSNIFKDGKLDSNIFLELIALPPKEFCERLGLSKETQQYLEHITKVQEGKEAMLQYSHINSN